MFSRLHAPPVRILDSFGATLTMQKYSRLKSPDIGCVSAFQLRRLKPAIVSLNAFAQKLFKQ